MPAPSGPSTVLKYDMRKRLLGLFGIDWSRSIRHSRCCIFIRLYQGHETEEEHQEFVTDEASPIRNDIHVRLQSEGVTYAQRNMHDTIPRNVKMAHLRHVIDTFRTTIQEKMSERTW